MKNKPFHSVLLLALMLSGNLVYGQGSLGPEPKGLARWMITNHAP
jgi:hypothetical protein